MDGALRTGRLSDQSARAPYALIPNLSRLKPQAPKPQASRLSPSSPHTPVVERKIPSWFTNGSTAKAMTGLSPRRWTTPRRPQPRPARHSHRHTHRPRPRHHRRPRRVGGVAAPAAPVAHAVGAWRKTVATLPTLLTLGNLLCGFAAIFTASRIVSEPATLPFEWTPLTFAAIFIFLGMVFDSLDGGVARLTRSASELGEQLDSMADMVTFGVAPAFVAVQLVNVGVPFITQLETGDALFDRFAVVVAGIYIVCAALRLARFNIELEGDSDSNHASFKGLPSPGAAGTVASLILLHQHFLAHYPETHWLVQVAKVGMVAVMLLAGLAMVSMFQYVHVVNRYVRGGRRSARWRMR